MSPGLVGPVKAARGKLPTDTWWHTIVATNGKEKTGYPTQKPLGVINRIITASSNPGDTVMDFVAGSGTVGESCLKLGRQFVLVDNNPEALEVMAKRFTGVRGIEWSGFQPGNTVRKCSSRESQSLTHRFLHQRFDLCFVGGSQLLQCKGGGPHGAIVEVRRVVEA